jgi:hypothetical protein
MPDLSAERLAEKLEHYDIPALVNEALAMSDPCRRGRCAAPTVHLLATLLRESTAALDAAQRGNERLSEHASRLLTENALKRAALNAIRERVGAIPWVRDILDSALSGSAGEEEKRDDDHA